MKMQGNSMERVDPKLSQIIKTKTNKRKEKCR